MTVVLALDTATPATVVGVGRDGELVAERRHEPAPGERPGHARQLLPLAAEALAQASLAFADVGRVGVGTGPGTFTGLRIGVACARAVAQGAGASLAAVSSLEALARGVAHDGPVLACLDARRGEVFVAAWAPDGGRLLETAAWRPERLDEVPALAPGPWLAVGDGAVGSADRLRASGVLVPDPGDAAHGVRARPLVTLAAAAAEAGRDGLLPEYVRAPDAKPRR